MRKILSKTFALIVLVALINLFAYVLVSNRSSREILQISNFMTVLCATPILIGLFLSYVLTKSTNLFIKILYVLFLIGNGFLLIFSIILIIIGASFSPITLLTLLYIAIGWYVYFNTIHLGKTHLKEAELSFSDSDILDDNFGEL